MKTWHIRFEWKIEDCWVGAYWRNSGERFDLWICLLPMVPLHYWHEEKKEH